MIFFGLIATWSTVYGTALLFGGLPLMMVHPIIKKVGDTANDFIQKARAPLKYTDEDGPLGEHFQFSFEQNLPLVLGLPECGQREVFSTTYRLTRGELDMLGTLTAPLVTFEQYSDMLPSAFGGVRATQQELLLRSILAFLKQIPMERRING